MKHFIPRSLAAGLGALTLAAGAAAATQPRQVQTTDREIFLHGDFHDSGLDHPVIIDRETGLYRAAIRDSSGAPNWLEARTTGIPAVEGAAVGRFRSPDRDEFVATHPDANQLLFIHPGKDAFAAHPHRIPSPDPGPMQVAAGWFDESGQSGLQELLLLSGYNLDQNGTPFELGFYSVADIANGKIGELARMSLAITKPGVLGPASHPALAADFGMLSGDGSFIGQFSGYALAKNQVDTVVEYLGNADTRFETATLFADPDPSFLVWSRGEETLHHFVLGRSTGMPAALEFFPVKSCSLKDRIETVRVLEDGSDARILVVFAGSGGAAVFSIYDGCMEDEIARFPANDRESILGAVPDGEGGFTLMTGRRGGLSTGFQDFRREADGSYSLRAAGRLPDLDDRLSYPNLVGFDADPFLFPEASLVDYYRYRDWTIGAQVRMGRVQAVGETFRGEQSGLGSASQESVGDAPSALHYLLPNQLSADVSVAPFARTGSRTPDSITVDPPPGTFDRTVRLSFSTTIPDETIYYRIDGESRWEAYHPSAPVTLFTDSTVQFYARSDSEPNRMTAVSSATYTFSRSFHEFDSNRDGVPDFVRAHFGLDPFGHADTTGTGFTDLQKILSGNDPLDPDDVPSDRIDLGRVFDAHLYALFPNPGDAGAAVLGAAEGTALQAHDFDGTRHARAMTGSAPALPSAIAGAWLERLAPGDGRLFFTASTPSVFETAPNPGEWSGHEMVGLFPLPALEFPVIEYTPAGQSMANEVARWLDAARAAFDGHSRPILDWEVTPESTFAAAAFEHRLAELIAERDPDASEPRPRTLFPHRVEDAARLPVARADLDSLTRPDRASRELAHPLFNLPAAWESLLAAVEADDTRGENIRDLILDVYRTRALHFEPGRTVAPLPLDTFRHFLETEGDLPEFYAESTELTPAGKAAALTAVHAILLEAFDELTTVNYQVEILADTFDGNCRNVVDVATHQLLQLVDDEGNAYRFPASLRLPAGTRLDLSGFADAGSSTGCEGTGVEVVAINLVLLPTPVAGDADWNLLPDEWENLHFGRTGTDPFADSGGNGYSNLQSYFEGIDPHRTTTVPGLDPVDLGPPQIRISAREDGSFNLEWDYPAAYADQMHFYCESSADLSAWTGLEPDSIVKKAPGQFSATIPGPAGAEDGKLFYRLTMGLR